MEIKKDDIFRKFGEVMLPESGKTIADVTKAIAIKDKTIEIDIELDKKTSILKNSLEKIVKSLLEEYTKEGYQLKLNIQTKKLSFQKVQIDTSQAQRPLAEVKNIIAVASGKGGVGKSTVAVNLAVALANKGLKVGLLDADVYGPSVPVMLGTMNERPFVRRKDGKDYIIPIEKYGVKMISIGFFVKPEDALIWRGAMATSAIKQLINDVDWGELDYFIIDLPPGTGDVPLTMVQTIPVTGAVIVTTPQKVATADVVKAINMFRAKKIEVPILGIIENMAWFTPEECPDKKYFLFGKGGGEKLAKDFNTRLLGQVPLVQTIVEKSDAGEPAVMDKNSITGKIFENIATNLINAVEERNRTQGPTKILEIK